MSCRAAANALTFARSSLGLCKHLWWVLEQGFDAHGNASAATASPRALGWNPVRPLTGEGDWLARVQWRGEGRAPWPFDSVGNLQAKTVRDPTRRREAVETLLKTQDLDPALSALLRRERSHLERRVELTPSAMDIKRALKKLRQPLFPYQATGVARFLETGRLLLADDMGLGKTAQAIASCHVLHATARVKKGLIVVPAALKTQWLREWKHFTHAPASIVEGPPADRLRQYRGLDSGFLIVNYEQVLKDLPALVLLARARPARLRGAVARPRRTESDRGDPPWPLQPQAHRVPRARREPCRHAGAQGGGVQSVEENAPPRTVGHLRSPG